jgi:Txe/YoeB family toxin of Txe-Axe toxin-antitoxin module
MVRSIRFTPAAWSDDTYWQGQDKKTLRRINRLVYAADDADIDVIACRGHDDG